MVDVELVEVVRDDAERLRPALEELSWTGLIPASTVAFTAGLIGLELGGPAIIDLGVSTALSTSVFLLNGGSGTVTYVSLFAPFSGPSSPYSSIPCVSVSPAEASWLVYCYLTS